MINKIVMFSPKPSIGYFYQGLPLSLLAISSFLYKEGYEIKIIKAEQNHNYKNEVVKEVENASLLVITVMTGYPINEAIEVSKKAKKINHKIKIVWGGWHPSLIPEEVLKCPYVDIVVRGQGERTFYELVKKLENTESLENVLGISYKKENKIIHNPERLFEDVNNFPNIPYELINIEDYIMKTELGSRTVNLITSQGCPYRCGFCVEPLVYKRKWYGLNADRIVDNIEFFYKKYNIDSVFFNDSNFFVNTERVKKMCEELVKRDIIIKWGMANARATHLLNYNDDMWELIVKSGCKSVLIGAESGSQKILDIIKKDMKIEDIIKIAKKCKDYNIIVYFSFMVGIPPNPPTFDKSKKDKFFKEELKNTLDVIGKIISIYRKHNIYLFTYTPYLGTPLFDLSLKNGLRKPETLEEWANFELTMKNTPWVSEKSAKLVDYLHNFIFPFISGIYYNKLENRYNGISSIILKLVIKLFELIVFFRWKTKMFGLRFDYKLFRLILKLR